MKKIILSLALVTGSLTAFGQTTDSKTLAISDNGTSLEIVSDVPNELMPKVGVVENYGKIRSVDGLLIGSIVSSSAQSLEPNNGGLKAGDWVWIYNGNK